MVIIDTWRAFKERLNSAFGGVDSELMLRCT